MADRRRRRAQHGPQARRDRIRRLHLARTLRRHQCEVRFPHTRLLPGELRLRSGQHGDHCAARPRTACGVAPILRTPRCRWKATKSVFTSATSTSCRAARIANSSRRAPTCCTSARGDATQGSRVAHGRRGPYHQSLRRARSRLRVCGAAWCWQTSSAPVLQRRGR